MNGLHFVSVAQDPLLVWVGGEVVGGRVVGRHVEEQVTELGRRVFGTVGPWTLFKIQPRRDFRTVGPWTMFKILTPF
jgi:hypothetical protein